MSEQISPQAVEAEIQELSRQIEAKRAALEEARGARIESKEALQEVVREHVYGAASSSQPAPITPAKAPLPGAPYLTALDPETISKVNTLVAMIKTDGLKKTIARASLESPHVLDAFHDLLVEHLYEELKSNGLIK